MSKLPGNAGVSVLGDKSLEFYRDPVTFCRQRMEKHRSRVFQCRLLNRPTVFICSVRGVRELLCGMFGLCLLSFCACFRWAALREARIFIIYLFIYFYDKKYCNIYSDFKESASWLNVILPALISLTKHLFKPNLSLSCRADECVPRQINFPHVPFTPRLDWCHGKHSWCCRRGCGDCCSFSWIIVLVQK